MCKFLLFTVQGRSANTAADAAHTTNVQNRFSGVFKPRLPIQRLQIVLGEQQIQLVGSGGGPNLGQVISDVNLSDFPFLF
jgi:hypothetical protein